MCPILFQIGSFKIFSYGVMFALAVTIATWLLGRQAQRQGVGGRPTDPEVIYDLSFWLVLSGIVGARIYYVFLYPEDFIADPWEFFKFYHGGLAFQGGFITATLTAVWYLKKKKLPLLPMLDLLAPYIALAHAIGRIGCFLNGCCYGKEVPWGLYFPVHEARLHPTQLYDTVGLLIVFLILRKFQKSSRTPGAVFAWYLILAGIQRVINEFFRADHAAMYGWLSNFQVLSLGILLAGIVMLTMLKAKAKK